MLVKEAKLITGGLSKPSKMPGHAYSLPAQACKMGGKLQKIEGSVCHKCYALKNRYLFRNVREALEKRLETITDPNWVVAMVFLINKSNDTYFRWHDSGDIQSKEHLLKIFSVCEYTPNVSHWLPTREHHMVKQVLKQHTKPKNLCIRISAHMVDSTKVINTPGCVVSTVSAEPVKGAWRCPASGQGNVCGDCRSCWDDSVKCVDYPLH